MCLLLHKINIFSLRYSHFPEFLPRFAFNSEFFLLLSMIMMMMTFDVGEMLFCFVIASVMINFDIYADYNTILQYIRI